MHRTNHIADHSECAYSFLPMKKCLVTTLGKSDQFTDAVKNLELALQSAMSEDITFNVNSIPSISSSIEQFSTSVIPHLLIVDPKSFQGAEKDKNIEQFFNGLRDLDPAVCIVVLWNNNPSASELMTWLDRGATGLYNPKNKNPESDAALMEALSLRVSDHLAREPRTQSCHKVRIQLASLEQAMAAETLNLGFGGMFLRISPREIKAGDEVEFQLEFGGTLGIQGDSPTDSNPLLKKMDESPSGPAQKSGEKIEGSGRVVWVRSTQKDGLPEGIGLQFSKLSPAVQTQIRNFVVNHRLHAFIPKA